MRIKYLLCASFFFTYSLFASGPQYVPLTAIHPGQNRYSNKNVLDKMDKAKKSGVAVCDKNNQCKLKYDNGKSAVAKEEAVPVIQASFGYVLLDGHHSAIVNQRLGGQTIPIVVKEDLSRLKDQEFWNETAKKGSSYPYAIGGAWQIPPKSFDKLVDDTNRYFATLSARKCGSNTDDASKTSGYEYPLWVKVGIDVPFIEFKISDALNKNGFIYDEKASFDQMVEQARKILSANPVPQLKLVKNKEQYLKIKNLCSMPAQ